MRLGEVGRWLAAAVGTGLWLAIPFIVIAGGAAKLDYRCQGRTFTGKLDECFSDYIPVLEGFVIPALVLVLAYPFARFAFTLYAPPPARRTLRWRAASRDGAIAGWPILQVMALAGAAWAVWRALSYASTADLLPFHFYWGGFAAWFALGALLGLLDRRHASIPA